MIAEIIAGYAAAVATASVLFQFRQTRLARKPQIELELIHTQMQGALVVFLEVRNRGNHPIRIVGAGIDSPKVHYTFFPEETGIAWSKASVLWRHEDDNKGDDAAMLPLPGIILPRDAASRTISNYMIPYEDSIKLGKVMRGASPDEGNGLFEAIDSSLREELTGWVEVSTGEFIHTKPIKYDWDANLDKIDQSRIDASVSRVLRVPLPPIVAKGSGDSRAGSVKVERPERSEDVRP